MYTKPNCKQLNIIKNLLECVTTEKILLIAYRDFVYKSSILYNRQLTLKNELIILGENDLAFTSE